MIGFSNAFNNEYRSVNDCRNFIRYEQIFRSEDKNRNKKFLKWTAMKEKND